MEAKIDKRTKEYKESVLAQGEDAPVITNPEIVVEESLAQPSPLKQVESFTTAGVVESDRSGSSHDVSVPYTKDGGLGEPVAVCTDAARKYKYSNGRLNKVDLLHCPGCGTELLEDERNLKGPAYCRKCIWKDA